MSEHTAPNPHRRGSAPGNVEPGDTVVFERMRNFRTVECTATVRRADDTGVYRESGGRVDWVDVVRVEKPDGTEAYPRPGR